MDPLRGTLLWASGNATLREHLPRFRAVRKTVERFMPGETADDGLAAAERLATDGLPATFTLLGENVDDMSQATAAAGEYLRLLDRIDTLGTGRRGVGEAHAAGVRPGAGRDHGAHGAARRPLGRDGPDRVDRHGIVRVRRWHDRPVRDAPARALPNTGLCMQAYLHRTWDDVQKLAPLGPDDPAGEGRVPRAEGRGVPGQARDRRELLPAGDAPGDERPPAGAGHARHRPRRAHRGGGAGRPRRVRGGDALRDPRRRATPARPGRVHACGR